MISHNNNKRDSRDEYVPLSQFEAVTIKVASPEMIRSWSHGEVKNAETINYRSFKPEKAGLFCEKIFGPKKDWECSCGRYKGNKLKGTICDHCGVEVTLSKVRRERMGHIELAVPVSHIWFFKCMPSRIGSMCDINVRALETVLYYEAYVVTDPGDTPLQLGQVLKEIEYAQAVSEYGSSFKAEMGAGAIRSILEGIELEPLREKLEAEFSSTKNKAIRKKLSKRLRMVEGFIKSDSRPEWMILQVLPVIPPDLRPLVPLDGGRFASSDLNDLYRRVINRNNRLKSLLQMKTPDVIVRNEKRMLQEAVDALLDNGRHGRAVTGGGGRNLKSLSEILKGKQGRFRQNLLGKRVDYSGRSVIVVGPELKLMQCGIPKKMALTLFEPFIIRYLKEGNHAHTVRMAKKMIERGDNVVWDILEKVTKGHPVMLNRAPTLHRLSIQAFDPILIEGSAIRLHPLVCTGYNADFDGDQMAVHVPLSVAAQLECKLLMLSVNNIFSPANGKPITTPTQDITLGVYYLTLDPRTEPGSARTFLNIHEVLFALDTGHIKIHDAVRIPNPDYGVDTPRGNKEDKLIVTTPGRCIFNGIWDKSLGFFNKVAKKKDIGALIAQAYEYVGHDRAIELLDRLKNLGYEYATVAGFSISIADVSVPEIKKVLIENARKEMTGHIEACRNGMITEDERHNKVVDLWTDVTNKVSDELKKQFEAESKSRINPVYCMMDSGARGSQDQIKQLAGMRGLMAKPNGAIIERPILSCFREGLSVLEYFISTHGARKGLSDTALKTADSGYMTRKLVDVAQDIICRSEDCGTTNGIYVSAIYDAGSDKPILKLRDRLLGRYSAADIQDPAYPTRKIILAGEPFTPEICDRIDECGIKRVMIRSVLTCEIEHGVCVKCYGKNLATDKDAEIGDALGIIAAQSIGEPGTQLTMRTFHIGGTASSKNTSNEIITAHAGKLYIDKLRTVVDEKGDTLIVNKNGSLIIYDEAKALELEQIAREEAKAEAAIMGVPFYSDYDFAADARKKSMLDTYEIEIGSKLYFNDGDFVPEKAKLAEWDKQNVPIIAEESGVVHLHDMIQTVTFEVSGNADNPTRTIVEHSPEYTPQVIINEENSGEVVTNYPLPSQAILMVEEDERVSPGKIIARVPRQQQKTTDITGGLPRVSELFEARNPREIAEIASMDGEIVISQQTERGQRPLYIKDPDSGLEAKILIKPNKHLLVSKGDRVRKGDKLTSGSIVPQKLLEICGPQELQRFLVNEVQTVYRTQNVEINDKHIEIIIRQMMQKIRVTDQGDTRFLVDETVDRYEFARENDEVKKRGGTPARGEAVLLGISKASSESESFISSASFQDTTRILTDAATLGREDTLRGFKENVITGHLIPAGTGSSLFQNLMVKHLADEILPDPTEAPVQKTRPERPVESGDTDITAISFEGEDAAYENANNLKDGLDDGEEEYEADELIYDENELDDMDMLDENYGDSDFESDISED